jgi:methylmalonyl-CoA/ethylmalonyl-CoA epimerase
MRFHHVGYATRDIDLYVQDFFRPVFAPLSISEKVSDPIQRVTVCFARMQGNTLIELVEPLGTNSPIEGVIGSNRGGVYHLCYEVDDLEREIARCRQRACMPISKPVPAAAFNGRQVVFLLTPQHDLIEFVEKA